MPTTYTNGLKLPDLGSIDWYSSYKNNIDILDPIVGAVNSKQDSLSTTQLAAVNSGITASSVQQIGTNADNISGLQTAVASKAADNSVVHLAGAETITGDKTFTGATATHNITPETTGTYSLGSSSYQWASVYAQTYYYNGTAWGLDKANEWTENNIFSKNISPASVTSVTDTTLAFNGLLNTIFLNTRGSSNRRSYGSFLFVGYGTTSGVDNYGQIQLLRSTDKRGDTNEGYVPDTSFKMWRVAPHSLIMDAMEAVRVTNDGTENSLKPITTNATDLGTSTNKWKTLNGINPGALSLPNTYINLDTTDWNLTGTSFNYVPSIDGWLFINVRPDNNYAYVAIEAAHMRNNSENTTGRNAMACIAVRQNVSTVITLVGASIAQARLVSCAGNV